jgi:RNA polymerase sigma-70 factor (ECF subfamily)
MILRISKNPAIVEDLVQESLIKAYRSITSFRGDSAFYTWLYKIGLNTARNYLYDAKRSVHIDETIALEDADNISTSLDLQNPETPESELMNKQIIQMINDAISALPIELRTAIILREIEGLSYEQISEAMNCPIGTTRSRIFRARDMISEKLKPLLNKNTNKRW